MGKGIEVWSTITTTQYTEPKRLTSRQRLSILLQNPCGIRLWIRAGFRPGRLLYYRFGLTKAQGQLLWIRNQTTQLSSG
jgi:hypothetical protein